MDVTTTPVALGTSAMLIQNLGPDALYLGEADVTDETGVLVSPGESLVVGNLNHPLYAVSSAASDVRILVRGQGIFPAPVVVP